VTIENVLVAAAVVVSTVVVSVSGTKEIGRNNSPERRTETRDMSTVVVSDSGTKEIGRNNSPERRAETRDMSRWTTMGGRRWHAVSIENVLVAAAVVVSMVVVSVSETKEIGRTPNNRLKRRTETRDMSRWTAMRGRREVKQARVHHGLFV
jgi:hypothetical protein